MKTPLADYARQGRRLDGIPVFDVHAHVGQWPGCEGQTVDDMIAEMDRIGIDVAAVSSTRAIGADFAAGNDLVADAMRRYPSRFIGYCHVSAMYPDLILPELRRCFARRGFKGIKVYVVGAKYNDPRFDPVWTFARDRRAPVLAHTWGGELNGLDKAAERFPDVAFMAAHTGSGLAYEPYVEAARRLKNFVLDLTYSREHTNMIETIVDQVALDQIVWGSDAPCFSMSHQIGKILMARIPDEAKRRIICRSAARLFGLTVRKAVPRPAKPRKIRL